MAMRRTARALLRNTQGAMSVIGIHEQQQHHQLHHLVPHEYEYYQHHHHPFHPHEYHPYQHHQHRTFHAFGASKLLFPSPHLGHFRRSTMQATQSSTDISHSATIPSPDLSNKEAHKLLKLVKIDDFKRHLLSTGNHCMSLPEILSLCKETGAATTNAEAEEVIKNLDEAGVILIFRNRVFLEPEKVAELLSKTMPFHLAAENDPRSEELLQLKKEKEEIDQIAQRQVRNMLWGALGLFSMQSVLFFRLTFWDLSWDVMEPITFFVTSSSLLAGFFFFVLTHRDPSYHDLMNTLLTNKQKKLMKKRKFNEERFKELQVQCCMPVAEKHLNGHH